MLADGEVMDDSGGDVSDVSDVGTDGTVFDQLDTEGLTPTGGPVEQPGDRDLSAIGAPTPVGQAPSTPGAYVPTQPTQQDIATAIGDTVQAGANTAEAQRAVPGAKSEQEDALARAEEDKATQVGLDRLELDDQREQHDAALKSATDDLNKDEQARKDFKFHHHWADKPLANKVLAVLFSAIGGGAAAVAKTPNYALAQIERAEQLDYNKQLQELRSAEKFMEWKRAGIKDMGAQFEKERAMLIQGQSYKSQQMADYAKAQYIRTGHTVEEANNNVIVQGLYQKAAEKKEEALSKLYSLETARIRAERLARATGKGGGGVGGAAERVAAVIQQARAQGIDPNTILPDIYKAGRGLKTSEINGIITADRASSNVDFKKDEKAKELEATDENGNPVGEYKNKTIATKQTESNKRMAIVQQRLSELIHDVEINGKRINPLDLEGTKRRESLTESVANALRPYNELSSTDASMHAERVVNGQAGTLTNGLLAGAQLDILKRIQKEVAESHRQRMNQALRSGGNPYKTSDAKPGNRPASQPHPQDSEAVKWANEHSSDPRAKRILELNQ